MQDLSWTGPRGRRVITIVAEEWRSKGRVGAGDEHRRHLSKEREMISPKPIKRDEVARLLHDGAQLQPTGRSAAEGGVRRQPPGAEGLLRPRPIRRPT
jgi:hypothetical protein